MSRIIAIANQKGGVGKTTTCVNLAASLIATRRSVLLIDLDPQGNATMGCGIDKSSLENSICDVLLGSVSAEESILKAFNNTLDVLPSNQDLTYAEVELLSTEKREYKLSSAISSIERNFDYVLIDCPPSLNILTVNAFAAANGVLVPMQCEYYALEGLTALLDTIKQISDGINAKLELYGILRTMFDPRNNLSSEVSNQLTEHFGDKVFSTMVPRNVRLAEAPSFGKPVLHHDRNSRGTLAYLALAGEVNRREKESLRSYS
ncbi:MAG: chromosome partitioning protein [Gammaproteobacteria bacterium TMED78]|nr:MAG: chromosome partitioning protein [Gammaproteobacteria bacterium TMED78]|tara:strand:- start:71304 stop:72089 length:786 start_codon:yes stop_codon:yes gene_type:complete